MNDTITKEILRVLGDHDPPYSMRFTAGDMSEAILARLGDDDSDEKTKQIYGSRRVGRAMSKYLRQFAVIFKMMEPRILDGKTLYEVTGLTPSGELAISGQVGKVDSKATFQKSAHVNTGADGFSENGGNNPLNSLHARAQSRVSPSNEEEEEDNINENEEVMDGLYF